MKVLTLLFTYNTSVKDWELNGMLQRELNIYTKLLNYFDKIYFITYGPNDAALQEKMPANIIILPKKYQVNNFIYSFLIPFAYRKELQESLWIKTNQIIGSWTAIIVKLFFRKKIAIRTGYTESLFSINRSFLKQKFIWLVEFIAYKFATMSIVTSDRQKKYLLQKYHPKNIHVIPNSINTELFKPNKNLSAQNISKNTTIHLLFVGRLHKEKNIINLIKSLVNIDNVKLTIIGTGPLKNKILKISKKYNIHLTIIPRIPNSELPKTYNQADIYIQPSLYEGNPKTILEAMSCGLPVIATDIDGINNIITHKKTGYLCDVDIDSIKNAILELENASKLQQKLGTNARVYILKNYDLNIILKKEISLYKNN